jgi:hypothetical protein
MKRHYLTAEKLIIYLILLFLLLPGQLTGQSEKQDTLAQYLFPSFIKSRVITKNGTQYNLMLNYNIISEKLVFEQKGKYFDLANPETVDTAFILTGRFVPRDQYFLEVISGGKVSLFKRNKGELTAPPRPAGYGTTTDLTSSNLLVGVNTAQGYYNFKLPEGYTVHQVSSFWVRTNEHWTRFTSENQLVKVFPEKEKEIKQFIKENKLRISKKEDLTRIGNYINELIK